MTAPRMFVVRHVRHALQQVAAIGAFSPYFPAACTTRPVQICFMFSELSRPTGLAALPHHSNDRQSEHDPTASPTPRPTLSARRGPPVRSSRRPWDTFLT